LIISRGGKIIYVLEGPLQAKLTKLFKGFNFQNKTSEIRGENVVERVYRWNWYSHDQLEAAKEDYLQAKQMSSDGKVLYHLITNPTLIYSRSFKTLKIQFDFTGFDPKNPTKFLVA